MGAVDAFERSLLRAIGHPLRLRILEAVADAGETSPSTLARAFGQPLSTVSHHVRLLRDLGFLELARTEPRRGAVEHFYRAVRRPFIDDDEWEQLPVAMRRGLARQTLRHIFTEAAQAGGDGGFDRPGAYMVRLPMELDAAARRELAQAMLGLLRDAEAIQRRSDERRATAVDPGGGPQASSLVLLHFDAADPAPPTGPETEGPPQGAGRVASRQRAPAPWVTTP